MSVGVSVLSVRVNGEPLNPSQWEDVHESRATSDVKNTPSSYERYDPLTWIKPVLDAQFEAIESKTPPRSLDISDVRALFVPLAEHAGAVEVELYGALALLYWGHTPEARKPRKNDDEEPPFATYKQALQFLVMVPARTLGIGPVRLDIAEEKDEHRTARAAAKRNGVEHIKTSGSFVGTSHVKGETLWTLRHDILAALAECGEPVHVRALIHKDIGEWVPLKKGESVLEERVKASVIAGRLGATEDETKEMLRKTRRKVQDVMLARGITRQDTATAGKMRAA